MGKVVRINASAAIDALHKAHKRHQFRADEKYQLLIEKTLHLLAASSPQWTGLFAASWRIRRRGERTDIGGAWSDAMQDTGPFKLPDMDGREVYATEDEAREMGHPEAVEWCMQANAPAIERINIRSRVTFYNDTPYAEAVTENRDPELKGWHLRPGNYVSPLPTPIKYVESQLPRLYREVNATSLSSIRRGRK